MICSGCSEAFTAFRRRHHCRTCGKIYCNACCSSYIAVKFNEFKERIRVCRDCYSLLLPAYEEYAKNIKEPSRLLPPLQHQESLMTNKTIATVNDFIKNLNMNIYGTGTTTATAIPSSNATQIMSTTNNKPQTTDSNEYAEKKQSYTSNSSIDTLTKELGEAMNKRGILKNRRVIRRKRNDSDENLLSSSPLNDEQLNFIKPFLEADTHDEEDDDSSSSSDSENSLQKKSLPFINNILKCDDTSSNNNNEKLLKPELPAKPYLTKAKSNTNISENEKQATLKVEVRYSEKIPNRVTEKGPLFKRNVSSKELIHSEYGYLCKIPTQANLSKSSENLKEDSTSVNWSHSFFSLFSNKTIGVSSSNSDTANPSIIIRLDLFRLKDVNETTFGFDVIKNKTPPIERKTDSNDLNNNKDSLEKAEDSTLSRRASSNKITESIGSLKSKLKMFEVNYELKFTNKEIK